MGTDRHTSPDQVVSLVGLWWNGANAVIRPDRQVAVAEYWWRKWLPLLGAERWMLVTVLRWLYAQAVDLDAPRQAAVTLEFKVPELAEALGMSEKTVYRLLDSEPIENEKPEKPWRRLALPKRARVPEEEKRRVELLRLFIPRLRYTAERRDGVTRRTGMMVELVLDVLPTPEDAEALEVQIPQRGISTPPNDEVQIPQRGISTQVLIPKGGFAPVQIPQRGTHACLLANIPTTTTITPPPLVPPPRRPSRYPLTTLKNQFPIQPGKMPSDEAFNLALDRALALLPPKIRKGAEDALYALAAEAHPVALEAPSRYWPDAGGAGWVVDAVVDAKAARTEIGSVNLIRVIVERWIQEGNPYSLSAASEPAPSGLAGWEEAVRATWEAATDKPITDEGVETLLGLLGPGDGRTSLEGLLSTIVAVGRRLQDPTVEVVAATIEGRVALPPPAEQDDGGTSEAVEPARPTGPDFALPDENDPLLAEVARWYLSEIGTITEGVADQLRALVREYPDVRWWREAFEAVVRSNVRRLDYVVGCLERAKAGKRPLRPAKRRSAKRKPAGGRSKQSAATGRLGKPPAQPVDEDEVKRLRRQYEEWVKKRQREGSNAR